jgi:hypothetical protein
VEIPSTLPETQRMAVDIETCRFQNKDGEADLTTEAAVPQNVTDDQLCAVANRDGSLQRRQRLAMNIEG